MNNGVIYKERVMYRVTIEKLSEPDERGYRSGDDVYKQTVEDLDVMAVIEAVNNTQKILAAVDKDEQGYLYRP